MRLADKLTLFRVILTPLFFAAYLLTMRLPAVWTVLLLWAIFTVSEITDKLDGMAARKMKESSDFGKLFDPFADTLMQLTCFLCFVIDGIIPAALFLIVLYREFSILFVRNLMLIKGITMGARMSGKIKTVTYITAASACLLYVGLYRMGIAESVLPVMKIAAVSIFCVSVVVSVVSFFDYVSVYRASKKLPIIKEEC
jgi:CDP-diacylglycerol--glycerol-3-phosphate 3-phosphatidyltransferase